MSATSFFGGAFFGGEFFHTATAVLIDTHDGFDWKKRAKRIRKSKDDLRKAIKRAFGWPDDELEPELAALKEAAAPYVEATKFGQVVIDWATIEASRQALRKLWDAYEAYQYQMELEADDEEVVMLLQ